MERTDKNLAKLNILGKDATALALRSFLAFLQGLFRDGLFGYRWSEDRNTTDIIIAEGSLDGRLSSEALEKLPAIFLTEGPAQWGNINTAAVVFWELAKGHQQLKTPENFTLQAKVVAQDVDEVKDITSTVFASIPLFPSLIARKTGIAFPAPPSRFYSLEQTAGGSIYPVGIIQMHCSVMVGFDVMRKKGSIFDTLLKSVTLSVEAALPPVPESKTRHFVLGHTPKDMLDVVITGKYGDVPVVEDPNKGQTVGEGVLIQKTELRED